MKNNWQTKRFEDSLEKVIYTNKIQSDGWEEKRLKEIGVTQTGTTPKTSDKENYGDFIPFVKPADVDISGNGEIRYRDEGLTAQGLKNGRKISKGSILMVCIGATIGKVGFVDRDVSCNQQINSLTVNKAFYPKFFYYALSTQSFFKQVIKNAAQATLPIINKGKWENLSVHYPKSLPEQQRIVTILDEAFAAIATAKENAEKNLQNARELFESYLQSVFANPGDEWIERKLGEVSKISYGYTEKAYFKEIGPKFLSITDIQNNTVVWESVPFCKCSKDELPKYKLYSGDIVFARTGATTGKSYLLSNPPESVFASYLIRLQISSKSELLPELLYYYFQTRIYWDNINAGVSGSAQGGFNATKLGDLKTTFPKSLPEQRSIVSKLDALSTETSKLEAIYQQKLADLDELKKSVLQKAFNGGLA